MTRHDDRRIRVGPFELSLTHARSVDVGNRFQERLPLDDHTFVFSEYDLDSVWIADIREGTVRLVAHPAYLVDVDLDAARILVYDWAAARVSVIDRGGNVLAVTTSSTYYGAFLADGTVAFAGEQYVRVWNPDTGDSAMRTFPDLTGETEIFAVGTDVVVMGDGQAFSIDPGTGTQLGEAWESPVDAVLALSPDGTRFVTTVGSEGPRDGLEMRESATGAVLGRFPGPQGSYTTSVVWPTDDLIIASRVPSGTMTTFYAVPEVHIADTFGDPPVLTDPFVDRMGFLSQHGNILLVGSGRGVVALISASQSRP